MYCSKQLNHYASLTLVFILSKFFNFFFKLDVISSEYFVKFSNVMRCISNSFKFFIYIRLKIHIIANRRIKDFVLSIYSKCRVKISRLNITLEDGLPGIAFATVRNGGVDCHWSEQQKHTNHPAQKDKFNDSSIFHRLASVVLFYVDNITISEALGSSKKS